MDKRNTWGGLEKDNDAELLLELVYGVLQEEGYKVKSFGEEGSGTTAYGGIVAERDGQAFNVSVALKRSGDK